MSIRALLVDDEEPARLRLRSMLERFDDLRIVGEAEDGQEALRRIDDLNPDVVFLDIEMPGLTGMQVAARLRPPRPRVIFCTAFDQYAVEAFEQHAADYLLKPVNRTRLTRAIDRIRRAIDEREHRRREVADARQTQARLYPQRLMPLRHLDYAGQCRPAGEVGGDYYDFLALDEGRLGMALGDVSGKGIFAGLLMANLQARVQSLAPRHVAAVDRLAAETSGLMHSATDSNRYATLFYGLFDDASRRLRWVNAAHPAGLVLRCESGTRHVVAHRLESSGTAIGLLPETSYRCAEIELRAGDLLCLITDGITEAESPDGDEYGVARLETLLAAHADRPAQQLCEMILDDVERFAATREAQDDRTVIVGRVR
jgi:sigma-B regulation protein RsbU (phosphoserine phosphatase)